MKDTGFERFIKSLLALGFAAGVTCTDRAASASDEVIPILKTKTATYTNVTITAKTETDLCILHDGGVGNVFLEDLDPEAYAVVEYVPPTPTGEKLKSLANEHVGKVLQAWQGTQGDLGALDGAPPRLPQLNPSVLILLGIVGFAFYFFFCYCYMLICRKAGSDPGILIWIPILQIFPLFRAAGMSGWYVLGLFLPVLNLIIGILWCFKIVSARGKSALWAVLMILPFTNLIALLYLAFSSGEDSDTEPTPPARIGGLAVHPV